MTQIESKPTEHFEELDDGRMILSPQAWEILHDCMVEVEHVASGPIKPPYSEGDAEILQLRQMYIDGGNEIGVKGYLWL